MRYFCIIALNILLLSSCGKQEDALSLVTNDNSQTEQFKIIGTDLGNGYSTDSIKYYYNAKPMDIVDTSSFHVEGGGYAADDSVAYYKGVAFNATFPKTLIYLGGQYAKDRFDVYYAGNDVAGARSASFKWHNGDTARDDFDTYIHGVKTNINQTER